MVVDDTMKDRLKQGYRIYSENKQAVKDLNDSVRDHIKELAEEFQVKSVEVRDAFKYMRKLEEDHHDALSSIVDVFESIVEDKEEEGDEE